MAHRHKNRGKSRHRTHENKPKGIVQTGRRVQGPKSASEAASAAAGASNAAAPAAPVAPSAAASETTANA